MIQLMHQYFIETFVGWVGIGGLLCLTCVILSYVFPKFRANLLGAAVVIGSVALIYAKGSRDRAALDSKKAEEAARRARKKYDEIDRRSDTAGDVVKRMRNNGF